ncbi:9614_t:CDS:2 [Funneliformis geosporum]|nr:9614_t:CDS:2 [Funneliformis geosporum]
MGDISNDDVNDYDNYYDDNNYNDNITNNEFDTTVSENDIFDIMD